VCHLATPDNGEDSFCETLSVAGLIAEADFAPLNGGQVPISPKPLFVSTMISSCLSDPSIRYSHFFSSPDQRQHKISPWWQPLAQTRPSTAGMVVFHETPEASR
jgi:hypothetical protein